jgi:hypothetical protein
MVIIEMIGLKVYEIEISDLVCLVIDCILWRNLCLQIEQKYI